MRPRIVTLFKYRTLDFISNERILANRAAYWLLAFWMHVSFHAMLKDWQHGNLKPEVNISSQVKHAYCFKDVSIYIVNNKYTKWTILPLLLHFRRPYHTMRRPKGNFNAFLCSYILFSAVVASFYALLRKKSEKQKTKVFNAIVYA